MEFSAIKLAFPMQIPTKKTTFSNANSSYKIGISDANSNQKTMFSNANSNYKIGISDAKSNQKAGVFRCNFRLQQHQNQ
jgi:hypothetical protein